MMNVLNNVTLRIAAEQIVGVLKLTEMNKKFVNSGCWSRFMLLLQEYLGFRYEIFAIGYLERIELILNNKIDLLLPISHNFPNSKIMDLSYPLNVPEIKFFVGKPSELSKITAIIRPFLIHVWISIFLAFVMSLIIFSIIFWIEAKLYKRKYIKIKEITWALFGSFTAKGNDLFFPSGKSCQVLVSGWLFATFVITSSYSGILMSFIAFPGRESVPRTYSQLINMANNGDYIINLHFGSYIKSFISNSNEGPGAELRNLLELNKIENAAIDEKLTDRIVKEKVAHISFSSLIQNFVEIAGEENYLISEDQLFSVAVGFGISKKFPYKKELNEAINRFIDAGFYVKFSNDQTFENEKKRHSVIQESGNAIQALNITDLAGPFVLLIIGYFVSVVVFFFELIVKKFSG